MISRLPLGWKGLDALVLLAAGVWQDARGLVHVPYRLPDGTAWREKIHRRGGGSYLGPGGEGVLPYGLEQVARPTDRWRRLLWLAEGESDVLCLREHYAAWRGYPVDVLGLPGAGTWRAEWARYAAGYMGVHIFPDADPAGERMAAAITSSVRWAAVSYLPPGEDVRGLVQRQGPAELDRHIIEAERVALLFAAIRLNASPAAARQWLRGVTL